METETEVGDTLQGIWMLIFPDKENTGNIVHLILTQGKLWQRRENCILVVESLTWNVIVESKGGKGWWMKFIKKKILVTYVLINTGKLVVNIGKTQGI